MEKWLGEWEAMYKEVCELITKGEHNEMLTAVEQLEQQSATLLDLWTLMDEKLIDLKQYVETFEAHDDSVYHSIGTECFEQNQIKRATICLSSEKANGQSEEWRRLFLAYAYLMSGKKDETVEQFIYLIQTAKQASVKHFSYAGLGCYYTVNGQVDRGAELFEQAKSLTPTSDVVYNLGVCYYLSGAFHLSAEHFELYAKHVDQDAEAICFHGLVRMKLNQSHQARTLWTQALSLYEQPEELTRLALLSEWYGHHELAVCCYQKALTKGADPTQMEHGMAWNYALGDKLQEAWPIFNRLIKEQPNNLHIKRSLYHLGRLFEEKQRT
ncbi:tetratricopeptide repeat protein [Alkalicoccobacillus murimartini]|uniref:Tetratricopeptide (TPR) repeat protein n=1 Tax=Alkalicoccobacillus murimartini TaxID=171685 RepID=A0ABT9YDN9_9BACI|nr:hypothetical protein [Alkalicoccobacillus murimartini]MDQ0205952.1 tetratricopeptide (TPR) repeat protein [Alkalicoccobacillus murimartini]